MRVATETDRPRGPPGKYPSSYIIIAYYDRSRVGTEPRPVARRGYLDRVRVRGKTVLYDTISYNYYDVEFRTGAKTVALNLKLYAFKASNAGRARRASGFG